VSASRLLSPLDEVAGGNAARCLLFPFMFFVSFMVAAMVYNAWSGECGRNCPATGTSVGWCYWEGP